MVPRAICSAPLMCPDSNSSISLTSITFRFPFLKSCSNSAIITELNILPGLLFLCSTIDIECAVQIHCLEALLLQHSFRHVASLSACAAHNNCLVLWQLMNSAS